MKWYMIWHSINLLQWHKDCAFEHRMTFSFHCRYVHFHASLFCTINMTPLHLLILIIKSSSKSNERCKDSIPSHKLMEGNAYMSDDYLHFVYLHSYTIYTLSKRYLVALLFHIIKICYWLSFLTFEDIIFYCTKVSVRQFISNP